MPLLARPRPTATATPVAGGTAHRQQSSTQPRTIRLRLALPVTSSVSAGLIGRSFSARGRELAASAAVRRSEPRDEQELHPEHHRGGVPVSPVRQDEAAVSAPVARRRWPRLRRTEFKLPPVRTLDLSGIQLMSERRVTNNVMNGDVSRRDDGPSGNG